MRKKINSGNQIVRPLAGLRFIVDKLNSEESDCPPWCQIKTIIENFTGDKSEVDFVKYFNDLAKANPVHLTLQMGRSSGNNFSLLEDFTSTSELGEALKILWRSYFLEMGWLRLKRCPHCQKWFVDTNRNRSKLLCSNACLNRYWSRAKRKEAGHKQYRRKEF